MSIVHHLAMLRDRRRCQAYRQALAATVRPGDVVLDLGSGTGLLGYFALQAGAAHVYAIEQDTATIAGAKQLAAANGYADRITWLQGRSDQLTPLARVDGIVAELFGHMGLEEDALRYTVDARERWLRPGGWMVPQSCTVWLAPVEVAVAHAQRIRWWSTRRYGLSWAPAQAETAERAYTLRLTARQLLADGQPLYTVPLTTAPAAAVGAALEAAPVYTITRRGHCHGVAGWFSTALTNTITLSTSPQAPRLHWHHTWFPLAVPCAVEPGDQCQVAMTVRPLLHQLVWSWAVTITRRGQTLCAERHSTAHTMTLPRSTAALAAAPR